MTARACDLIGACGGLEFAILAAKRIFHRRRIGSEWWPQTEEDMKSMRMWCVLPALLALLALPGTTWALNEWTILLYVVSDDKDTGLQEANARGVQDMVRAGAPAGCEILAIEDLTNTGTGGGFFGGLFGNKKEGGASIFTIGKEGVNVEKKLGEVNMGSPYVLWDFLKWAHEKHPAKRYALIFNSHGSGIFSWRGVGGTSSSNPGAVDFNPDRFVAYDTHDNDCLSVFEIVAVLGAFEKKLNGGRKLNVMGFDACLPASIEALYQFRNSCEAMIGSADTTPLSGFPYGSIMRSLARAVPTDAKGFAQAVSDGGVRGMGYWNPARAQELSFAFNNFVLAAAKARADGFRIRRSTSYGGKERYWDLERTLNEVVRSPGSGPNSAALVQMAKETLEAVQAARLVPAKGSLSVTWPNLDDYKQFRAFYKALDFAKEFQWDEYVDVEHGMK